MELVPSGLGLNVKRPCERMFTNSFIPFTNSFIPFFPLPFFSSCFARLNLPVPASLYLIHNCFEAFFHAVSHIDIYFCLFVCLFVPSFCSSV